MNTKFDNARTQVLIDDKPETHMDKPSFGIRLSLATFLQVGFMALCSIGLAPDSHQVRIASRIAW